jgi:hypothetical protein
MKQISFFIITISLALLTSCVVLPVNRTYYEPNPADGTPVRSSSCGWHDTALDALKRNVGGVEITVFPKYEKDQPLRIYLLFGKTSDSVEISPEMFEVRSGDNTARPTTIVVQNAGPYFFKSIDYTLPSSSYGEEISLIFLPNFLSLEGKDIEIEPFRFRLVTKPDVYYGSINC